MEKTVPVRLRAPPWTRYTLQIDRFYFSSGEGEDTQRCVGLENKRKKKTISLQSTFLGTFYFGDVSNSNVLLVGTQDSRTSLNKRILTERMKGWGLTGEGGVIWIPEPAWPLLGLGAGCSIECIRSHCIFCISQNHLYHQHSWEPTALFRLAVSFTYNFLEKKLRSLPNWAPTFSNLASGIISTEV